MSKQSDKTKRKVKFDLEEDAKFEDDIVRDTLSNPNEKINILKVLPLATSKHKIKINQFMKDDIIPKHPCSMVLCAPSGGGKTNLLVTLLKDKNFYGGYFNIIFLFSETASFGGDDLYVKHLSKAIPRKHMFPPNEEGIKAIKKIMKLQQDIIKKDGILKSPKILMLFDDIAHSTKFLKCDQYLMLHIANRHLNISTFSLTQSYTKIPRACRCQVSAIMFFHGCTNTEKERLADEHTPSGMTWKTFLPLIDYAIDEKYSFLFINKFAPMATRHRKGLHTILELN